MKFLSLAGEVRYDREVVKNYATGKPDPFYRAIWTDLLHDTSETPKFELEQVNRHFGGEITFLNTLSLRMGFLLDPVGARYELRRGFGIRLLNHLSFDWANVYSPEGYMRNYAREHGSMEGSSGARDGQWQISLTATRLFKWDEKDLCWWQSEK